MLKKIKYPVKVTAVLPAPVPVSVPISTTSTNTTNTTNIVTPVVVSTMKAATATAETVTQLTSTSTSTSTSLNVLYTQMNVHIRPTFTIGDDIAGELSLTRLNNSNIVKLSWKPYDNTATCVTSIHENNNSTANMDIKDSFANGFTQVSSDDFIETKDMVKTEIVQASQYAFSVTLTDLYAVKKYIPPIGYSVLSLVCSDGVSHPPLFFHDGGLRNFLAFMSQFVDITKSRANRNLYLINQPSSRSLIKPELLNLDDSFLTTVKEASWAFVEKLTKVTGLAWEGSPQNFSSLINYNGNNRNINYDMGFGSEYRQQMASQTGYATNSKSNTLSNSSAYQPVLECRQEADTDLGVFEILSSTTTLPLPNVKRCSPLNEKEWRSYFDKTGKIHDVSGVRRAIFSGGVEPSIRKEVWKYLFNYYPFQSTYAERALIDKQKEQEYYSIKNQWASITPAQESRFSKFRERKNRIEKDVVRTDRTLDPFKDDQSPYLTLLREILLTYTFYSFDVGYVQGMSDLLSPILLVLDNEVHTFWCFVGMMETMEANFHRDQHGMHGHLKRLMSLTKLLLPSFYQYLETQDGTNFFFAFRWLLIVFKREFSYEDVNTLWEVIWSNHLSYHFEQFFALAILDIHKNVIMENKMEFDEILKYINDLSMQLNVNELLQRAEVLFYQFAQCSSIPDELVELLQPFKSIQ